MIYLYMRSKLSEESAGQYRFAYMARVSKPEILERLLEPKFRMISNTEIQGTQTEAR